MDETPSRKSTVKDRLWEESRYETTEGYRADCVVCGTPMPHSEASMDRYPIPGCQGGTYAYENVRLTCQPCNEAAGSHGYHGTVIAGMSRREKRSYRRALRRATVVQLLPKDVFGTTWEPKSF